ncbi:hypothetical protein AN958_01452 [Leucoagaricus sp. SymC.cos]|nr:hypothetical protein AN958_01452 [Leucoagaricus sp. SymC.cos]
MIKHHKRIKKTRSLEVVYPPDTIDDDSAFDITRFQPYTYDLIPILNAVPYEIFIKIYLAWAGFPENAISMEVIKGGGGQFGVVVEFVLRAFPHAGPYTSGIMAYSGTEINNMLNVIQNWKETQTYQEKLTIQFSRPGPHFKPSVMIMPWVSHDKDCERSKIVLSPFLSESMKPAFQKIATVQDMLTVSHAADAAFAVAPQLLLSVWEKWAAFTEDNEDVRGSAILWDITSPAKMTEVAEGATALKTRVPHYWMAIQGRSTTDASVASIKAFTSSLVTHVRENNAELSGKDLGWFLSMAQGEEYPEDVYGKCLPRLRQVKAKYDPKQVWKKGVTIEPDFSG